MTDFTNLSEVLVILGQAQDAECDLREKIREVTHFLNKDDGQWEPSVVQNMRGRPRYTFDQCNPVVDAIAGDMEQSSFAIKVRPAGGESSRDTAEVIGGMIRNIESMSNAVNLVYGPSGRKMVATGFDAWRVTQEWAETDSFEQDLFIRKIGNSVDRVWFDIGSEMQDRSDANWVFVLQSMPMADYEKRFPDGSNQSVGDDKKAAVYFNKPDTIVVGEFLWKKPVSKELVLMSNNAVYEDDEKFKKVKKELKAQGVTEVKRRSKKSHRVYSRLFDGGKWLTEEQKTVFDLLPIIPTYGNFEISEDKVIHRGAIEKLMDEQRVLNYALSRDIEEGALSPRDKVWMTREQAIADQDTLQTMNTNANPVQTYTHVDGQAPPARLGPSQPNPGLQATASNMAEAITRSSGLFSANQGDGLAGQSGIALDKLQAKGDNSTIKYFKSQEIALCYCFRVLGNAIPRAYDTKRMVRILGEDGVEEIVSINDQVQDGETGEMVELNDLTKGQYDYVCDIGPAYKNRQQETSETFLKLAAIDPSVMATGKDILFNNIAAPGMQDLGKRMRMQLLLSGVIPGSQQTDEEKAKLEQVAQIQAQQGNQPDPVQQAILEQTQANTADVMSKAEERQAKAMLEAEKLRQSDMKLVLDAQKANDAAALAFQQAVIDQNQAVVDQQTAIVDALNTQASTLKTIREAMGLDAIVGPHATEAFIQQAEIVTETQDNISPTLETDGVTDRRT